MTREIINLSLPILLEKIEQILETYPHHPYQQAFANPDLRQILVAYALNRVPSFYVAADEVQKEQLLLSHSLHHCLEDTLHVERVIHEGILQTLQEHVEEVSHQIPEELDPQVCPSVWFG